MLNEKKPLVLIGGGGHAGVLLDILLSQGRDILAVISPDNISARSVFACIPHFTQDKDINRFLPDSVRLVNGIGMMPGSSIRKNVTEKFLALGYEFETVISSEAFISPFAEIGSGVQILTKAVVQTGARIDEHSIINSGVIIEHDANISSYCHMAPNSTICGQATVASCVFVGANATVIQSIRIRQGAVVGAGVTLTVDLQEGDTAYPIRPYIQSRKLTESE
ncbi:acetyltransferase [Marinomonas arenicola]|uniref:Acetyltransferase n=1 Tax=Marinomonas arenicola TaxID=569601 RepID=A0ABU9G7S8_9GAMM